MQTELRLIFGTLPLLLLGLQACTSKEFAACTPPNVIAPTHALIPYPPISQRLGERGTTRLMVAIGTDGTPTDVAISKTSGSKRLDNAAATYIKARYRWQPPFEGCKPGMVQAAIIAVWRLDPLPGSTVLTAKEADYSRGALEQAEEGSVILAVSMDDRRVVKDARVASSSGYSDLDAKALAMLNDRLGSIGFQPGPGSTQSVNVIWSLLASAIARQRRKGVEIVEIHAAALNIQEFDIPTPISVQ